MTVLLIASLKLNDLKNTKNKVPCICPWLSLLKVYITEALASQAVSLLGVLELWSCPHLNMSGLALSRSACVTKCKAPVPWERGSTVTRPALQWHRARRSSRLNRHHWGYRPGERRLLLLTLLLSISVLAEARVKAQQLCNMLEPGAIRLNLQK